MKFHWISLLLFLTIAHSQAQYSSLNVKHITVNEGLNDGIVNSICQDKFGYIWFASMGALNRFDGVNIKRFTHIQGDTTSALNSSPISIARDSADNLWIGYSTGLVVLNYSNTTFRQVSAFKHQFVVSVIAVSDRHLIVITTDNIYLYDIKRDRAEVFIDARDSVSNSIMSSNYQYDYFFRKDKMYMSADGSLITYHLTSKKVTIKIIPEIKGEINRVFVDEAGSVWLSCFQSNQLFKISADGKRTEDLSRLLSLKQTVAATDFLIDKESNLWIMGSNEVIVKLNHENKPTYYVYDNQVPANLLSTILKTMYQSSDGNIWFLSLTGVDHFNPEKNLFDVSLPFNNLNESKYSRVWFEDSEGNTWCATPDGLSMRNDKKNFYKVWKKDGGKENSIYASSVRSLTEDVDKNIWIATAEGMNRYNLKTGKMDFLGKEDHLPLLFYYYVYKDRENNLWFGTKKDDGLFYYDYVTKKINSVATHPVLKKYHGYKVRCIYEDSKKRLWIGFGGKGLAMYDPKKQSTRYWLNNDIKDEKTISGNTVIDIKEDKTGIVWVTTLNGITGIDLEKNNFTVINDRNGLKSNYCGPLGVDARNRIWVGTTNDLLMISADRKNLTHFNERDGLVSSSFTEHQCNYAKNGDLIFPTFKGFVRFNPLDYKEEKSIPPSYLTSYSVYDKEFKLGSNNSSRTIELNPDENYFSLNMVAINFNSPSQTWFAYQLRGFDKQWNYTQNPKAVYTNVPAGKYHFMYKASLSRDSWSNEEKEVVINIHQIFYRTFWFRTLITCLLLFILFVIYRYRTKQVREIAELNDRAQLLEREKSVAMYENLKQQLNPHFLFNSLTSLSSLISTEPKIARQFVDQMSKIYRYILKSSENELVPLSNEINFATTYIKLQQTRFSEGFEVDINVSEDYLHRKIVPVTIQNMVENSIKHNIIDVESPLVVSIYVEDEYLVVKNNLQKKSAVESSNKHGLMQMKSLYKYLSDQPIIVIENETHFIIKIPLI